MFDSEQFYPCSICRTMVAGPHACSPLALGNVVFESGQRDWVGSNKVSKPLTEADVRRIVREELAAQHGGR